MKNVAEKDITEKILESYNDVFADIVNVLLFDGEEIIREDELIDEDVRSAYKADGKIHELERDTAKRWVKKNIRIACIGLENQTAADADMPLRVIAYDGAEYRAELNAKGKKDRYPAVTLVLYFGYEKHWDKPTNLIDCLDIPAEFRPYVKDYGINLFEIAYLADEKVKKFKSDFRIVADYFVQMRKNNNYIPSPAEMEHVQAVLHMMSVMTGDHRFEDVCSNNMKEGGNINMCEVLDRIENRGIERGIAKGIEKGIAKGIEKGIAKGREEGITEMLRKYMNKHNCSANEAMDEFDISLSDREALRTMLE